MEETQPLERKRNVCLEKLFELVTFGNRDPDVLSSIASRLTRLDRQLTPNDRIAITDAADGRPLASIAGDIVAALDPDRHIDAARALSAGRRAHRGAHRPGAQAASAARPPNRSPPIRSCAT